jgi:ATP-dependent helicase HepA
LVLNHKLDDVSTDFYGTVWEQKLQKGLPYKLIENTDFAQRTLSAMFEQAASLAENQAASLRKSALNEMDHLLGHEVKRLQTLSQLNDHVRPEEIELAQKQLEELSAVIQQSRLRLDSVRLIWKGPPEALR